MASNRNTFMDYKAQIQHLKNKNLIIEDENFAIHILAKLVIMDLSMDTKKSSKIAQPAVTYQILHLTTFIKCIFLMQLYEKFF